MGRGCKRPDLTKSICLVDSTTGPAQSVCYSNAVKETTGGLGLPALVAAEIPGGYRRVMVAICWAYL